MTEEICPSDAGLLLFKEFLFKIGAVKLINRMFKTNDTAWFRIHKDDANLMQVIYQIISACFEDDCADELLKYAVERLQEEGREDLLRLYPNF